MTPENFCYWLQGYMELTPDAKLTDEQVKVIKEHLQLVFNKATSWGWSWSPNSVPVQYTDIQGSC
jgi:hypothetical protein